MKTGYLTSGPRGSGKSEYVSCIKKAHPEVLVVSRDEILITEFGATGLNPYTGDHLVAEQILLERMKETIQRAAENSKIIFDVWNGFPSSRQHLISVFREFRIHFVKCLYFITPLDTCIRWFMKKSDRDGLSEYSCKQDYKLYHKLALDIEKDGFDAVQRVNPLQLTFPGFPLI